MSIGFSTAREILQSQKIITTNLLHKILTQELYNIIPLWNACLNLFLKVEVHIIYMKTSA